MAMHLPETEEYKSYWSIQIFKLIYFTSRFSCLSYKLLCLVLNHTTCG